MQNWELLFKDIGREHSFEPLKATGTLPADLCGTLFHNGPMRFAVSGTPYGHIFDGDGGIVGVRFAEGRAWGAARVLQTPALLREQRARRRLYGGYNTPLARPFRELFLGDVKNPSNTGVLPYEGRVFALCEVGQPLEFGGEDLDTRSAADFAVITQGFTAHPKDVPARRAVYGTGLVPGARSQLEVFEFPYEGKARRLARIPVPGTMFLHDFAATERHLVFMIAPLRARMLPLLLRRGGMADCLEFRPELGTQILVVPIDAPDRPRTFKVPAFYVEHLSNAFENGEKIEVDITSYTNLDEVQSYVGGLHRGSVGPLHAKLQRARIDLRAETATFETLTEGVELPVVSPRRFAQRHRHVYVMGFDRPESNGKMLWNSVLKVCTENGTVERYSPGAGQVTSEPQFVPRSGSSEEDDGYLVLLVHDTIAERTRVDVLDARRPSDGPIGSAAFDQLLPFRVHGRFDAHTKA